MIESTPNILYSDGRCLPDRWRLLREVEAGAALPDQPALLPLAAYLDAAPSPLRAPWLAPADDPAALRERLDGLALIAIDFPKFTDGRGCSLAALLRGRYGYRGELRAVGTLLVDQLFMLHRVGFDAYALRADQPVETARAALSRYSAVYQAAADAELPAWRRRLASAAAGETR